MLLLDFLKIYLPCNDFTEVVVDWYWDEKDVGGGLAWDCDYSFEGTPQEVIDTFECYYSMLDNYRVTDVDEIHITTKEIGLNCKRIRIYLKIVKL